MRKMFLKRLVGVSMTVLLLASSTACGIVSRPDPIQPGGAVPVETTESAEGVEGDRSSGGIVDVLMKQSDGDKETTTESTEDGSDESTEQGKKGEEEQTMVGTTYIRDVEAERVTPDVSIRESASRKRESEWSVEGLYPDADYIEHIAEGRFVVVYRNRDTHTINGLVYDLISDTELNSFSINDLDTYSLTPDVFDGQGFGFIVESSGKNGQVFGYYYDIDGNEVSTFNKSLAGSTTSSYALAADGSAMYVEMNDREQCACGFDFKADYTTQVYAIHRDGSEELLREYDSHTNIELLGTTSDNNIVVSYNYNPEDIEVMTHEEYEQQWAMASNKDIEIGYALLNPNKDKGLDKFFVSGRYYDFNEIFIRGNKINFIEDGTIIHFYPDATGNYQGVRYTTEMGLDGYMTYNYVSVNGDYIVYPVYTDDFMDTKVVVLHFNGDKPEILFEEQYSGKNIEFNSDYQIAYYDEEVGNFVGIYHETKEGGLRNQLLWGNIYRVE